MAKRVFRGFCTVTVDPKGRLALPTRYREPVRASETTTLVITLNPWDRCLWIYTLPAWEAIDTKLLALPDGDVASRRAKQMIRGHACDCECDVQGRILIPQELRELAGISRRGALLGQGNKLELWDAELWEQQRGAWLQAVENGDAPSSSVLTSLSL